MREIKFRGVDKNKYEVDGAVEFVYGGVVHQTDYYGNKVDRWFIIDGTNTQDYDIGENTEVIHDTIGQFTGVKDKNGVDIYEGDIVKYRKKLDEEDYEIAKVVFDKGCCRFSLWTGKYVEDVYYGRYLYLLNRPELHEVIGNIHQNRELLEK